MVVLYLRKRPKVILLFLLLAVIIVLFREKFCASHFSNTICISLKCLEIKGLHTIFILIFLKFSTIAVAVRSKSKKSICLFVFQNFSFIFTVERKDE